MNSISSLTGAHLRTYQTIFQHPASHNLGWRDVHALFRQVAQVEEEPNGNLKITRNGQVLVLHPSRTKDVSETDELMTLRHFLEASEGVPAATPAESAHWLLVIDHHEARILRTEMQGAVPLRILPHTPEDYLRHAQSLKEFDKFRDKPDPISFFVPVARALQGTGRILIFGSGTGHSSEMEQFIIWLKTHHADVAQRIIGSVVVDQHHLSDGQLLAQAREFYSGIGAKHLQGGKPAVVSELVP